MNVFNVALVTRAFLFFAYPTKMSGDAVWVSGDTIFGLGQAVDGLTVATPLGAAATSGAVPPFSWDMVTGLIPGSIGETSVIAIALGAILLLATGIASWKTMFSVFVGGAFMAWVFNAIGPDTPMAQMPWYEHLVLGGFCFGAVFMATDPVTSARTETGKYIFGLGQTVDGLTVATPLGAAATAGAYPEFSWDMVTGLIPGSIGETSVIAIALGAILLLWTGIASWKTMFSVFVGGAFMGWVFNTIGPDTAMAQMPWYEHLVLGGFCFGAVFMATDPVTSARTETGKYIFGFLIGAMAIIIRVLNPGYPEGMMLAILLMNIFAPLIDYCVVQGNISRREKRATAKSNN